MIEVEAKAVVENLSEIKKKAAKIGKYIGHERKIDEYYTLENLSKYPEKSIRIRKKEDKYEVNFKRRLSYIEGVHAKKEVELEIQDISGFKALIKDFGFKLWLKKEKETYLYKIKKNFHIEINKVKNLGWFIEVEYLCRPREINKARDEVLKIAELLGIRKEDVIEEGYTKLLWRKLN